MAEAMTGGCLCGSVRYRVGAEPVWAGHCHCSMCRRASGAPFVTWVVVPRPELEFTGGAPKPYVSSDRASRSFCPDCGTQIMFTFNNRPNMVAITAASLDEPGRIKPQEHLFWEDRIAGLEMPDGLPRRPPRA